MRDGRGTLKTEKGKGLRGLRSPFKVCAAKSEACLCQKSHHPGRGWLFEEICGTLDL